MWKLWPYHGKGGGDFVHSAEILNNGHSLKMTPIDNKNMHIHGRCKIYMYLFSTSMTLSCQYLSFEYVGFLKNN